MNKEKLINDMIDLLHEYDHEASYDGCKTIVDEWERNKAPLMEVFSNHPNWDDDNARIVFSNDYTREFERSALQDYVCQADAIMEEMLVKPNNARINGLTKGEASIAYDNASEQWYEIDRLKAKLGLKPNDIIGNKTIYEYQMAMHTAKCILNSFRHDNSITHWCGPVYLPNEIFDRCENLTRFNKVLTSSVVEGHIVTEELMEKVKEIFPDIRTGAGTTLSKLLRKVMAYYPEMMAWKDKEFSSWYDDNGEYHSREREITYDTILTRLSDKISPLHIQRHTIISFNPLDYLTMSFGANWASCHTIDKGNKRRVNANHYQGAYCSGTLSYMLDSSSIIFYTVDRSYEGNAFETQDKQNRVMFHLSPDGDAMVQGRVYPDGRDGGDNSLAKQFREVMQKVVSDVFDKDNRWTLKRGLCNSYTTSYGTHYADYNHYEDCNISFRVGCDFDGRRIAIGHNPICPDTGESHCREDELNADGYHDEYNEDDRECHWCNEYFYYEDGIYCEDNGNWYCCEGCANDDDVHYCRDDGEWHDEDNCYRDDYDGEYYSGEPYITTDDYECRCYSCVDNAIADGYVETEDGYWYYKDEVFTDSEDGSVYNRSDIEVNIHDGELLFASEENAEDYGCVCVGGVWYENADEALDEGCILTHDTDEWYADEDEARENGCVYIADEDVWYSSEESAREDGMLNDTEVA